MVSYEPMFWYMKEHNISTYMLLKSGIDNRTLNNLKHNKNINLFTAEKICKILRCNIEDIVEFVDND